MGHGWGGMWFSWIFWIIIIVIAVYLILRYTGNRGGNSLERRTGNSARDILDRRYASGEISEEEYQRKKRDLDS